METEDDPSSDRRDGAGGPCSTMRCRHNIQRCPRKLSALQVIRRKEKHREWGRGKEKSKIENRKKDERETAPNERKKLCEVLSSPPPPTVATRLREARARRENATRPPRLLAENPSTAEFAEKQVGKTVRNTTVLYVHATIALRVYIGIP